MANSGPHVAVKPPAKVDGLLHFGMDLASQYTQEERRAMLESQSGLRVAQALGRCEGIKKNLLNLRNEWLQDKENKAKIQKLERERNKYQECLAYMSCPTRWKVYTQCWNSNAEQLINFHQVDPQLVCTYERQILENCIGGLVSSTIRVAETSTGITELSDDVDLER